MEEYCVAVKKMDIISTDEGTVVLGEGRGRNLHKKILKFKSLSETHHFISYFKAYKEMEPVTFTKNDHENIRSSATLVTISDHEDDSASSSDMNL